MTASLNPKLQPPMESINTSSYRIISAATINANVVVWSLGPGGNPVNSYCVASQ